jgi:hypothetical protein
MPKPAAKSEPEESKQDEESAVTVGVVSFKIRFPQDGY